MSFEQYESVLYESASKLGRTSPCPIRLRSILLELGVCGVRRDKLDGVRSILVDAGVKPVIILNTSFGGTGSKREPFTRWERFLIAHELGHLVLHRLGAKNPSGPTEYWKLEKLCDAFARRLLIPEHAVEEATKQTTPSAIDRLQATLAVTEGCLVPWSVAAIRVSDVSNDALFFRVVPVQAGGFKVVVSTRSNQQGIGQQIKPGTSLYDTFRTGLGPRFKAHEIDGQKLSGIAGIDGVRSGAAYSVRGAFCLAVVPS